MCIITVNHFLLLIISKRLQVQLAQKYLVVVEAPQSPYINRHFDNKKLHQEITVVHYNIVEMFSF